MHLNDRGTWACRWRCQHPRCIEFPVLPWLGSTSVQCYCGASKAKRRGSCSGQSFSECLLGSRAPDATPDQRPNRAAQPGGGTSESQSSIGFTARGKWIAINGPHGAGHVSSSTVAAGDGSSPRNRRTRSNGIGGLIGGAGKCSAPDDLLRARGDRKEHDRQATSTDPCRRPEPALASTHPQTTPIKTVPSCSPSDIRRRNDAAAMEPGMGAGGGISGTAFDGWLPESISTCGPVDLYRRVGLQQQGLSGEAGSWAANQSAPDSPPSSALMVGPPELDPPSAALQARSHPLDRRDRILYRNTMFTPYLAGQT